MDLIVIYALLKGFPMTRKLVFDLIRSLCNMTSHTVNRHQSFVGLFFSFSFCIVPDIFGLHPYFGFLSTSFLEWTQKPSHFGAYLNMNF